MLGRYCIGDIATLIAAAASIKVVIDLLAGDDGAAQRAQGCGKCSLRLRQWLAVEDVPRCNPHEGKASSRSIYMGFEERVTSTHERNLQPSIPDGSIWRAPQPAGETR